MMPVTKKFIEQFKVGDEVEIYLGWVRGKLIKYDVDPPSENKAAAHFEVQSDWEGCEDVVFADFHIEGDQVILRFPLAPGAYARYTVKRVPT